MSTPAEQLAYTLEHYTKYEYKVPVRDGARLFTAVYMPKDACPSRTYPMMMKRTPYSIAPYGPDNYKSSLGPTDLFTKEGFIFVYQDVRGRYESEGVFVDIPPQGGKINESTDTNDTIKWLLRNIPNHNGKVGICGISYAGFYAGCTLVNAHPNLKAVSSQAPTADQGNGDDAYHHGAFHLAQEFGFYSTFKPGESCLDFDYGTRDMYDFFLRLGPLSNARQHFCEPDNPYWDDLLEHNNPFEPWWQKRALAPHIQDVKPAALFVGGWFDEADLAGPLRLFAALEKKRPPVSTLVMGPWRHSGWFSDDGDTLGSLRFFSKTGQYYREQVELPFFVRHLKPESGAQLPPALPKALVFETGRNQWRHLDAWPPANTVSRTLYMQEGGKLDFAPAAVSTHAIAYDEYVSDPARPVPVTAEVSGDPPLPSDYMGYDQRFASRRTDVLTYVTEPLEEDVTTAGPITPSLLVSTSGTDSDFVVKLIDVHPDGFQQLVRGQPFRGKFRNSSVARPEPQPFEPNVPARIRFDLLDAFHTFRPGHCIMVQIQSSWFPLVDRNPQQFLDIPTATAAQFQKATQRVYRGGKEGSAIGLNVMQLPSTDVGA